MRRRGRCASCHPFCTAIAAAVIHTAAARPNEYVSRATPEISNGSRIRTHAVRLAQKTFVNRCHAPHNTPTRSPVANTSRCRLMRGIANPVQPISSKMPAPTATARPISTRPVLSVDVKRPGRNVDEISESVKSGGW
jgi:hypothetical protein